MDEITFTSSTSEQSNSLWLVYSNNPTFTAVTTTGFSLQTDKTFNGNKFMVTVR